MNTAFAFMYSAGFWLRDFQARTLSKLLMVFLQKFQLAAYECLQSGKHRFKLVPKVHMIHHAAFRLQQQSTRMWAINPIAESVQVQEDYIGRPSRLSRRVNIRRLHQRVTERSLICSLQALEASDADLRGLDV